MVGVSTAVAGVGLGLAVPINESTHKIIAALMHTGRVRRAWLGIAGSHIPVPPAVAAKLGTTHGLQLASVVPAARPPTPACGAATSWSASTATTW
ncbi:putative serine protease [Mycobacterium xenopi 4042]|uniref:Putative serine protease n=1 Tax=Mycobacterium xenopi 4042 TaxID=1299334 RepID=X8BED3_MYCXE|nr:putative serine protease [Mycobacterium xenopi 4042]